MKTKSIALAALALLTAQALTAKPSALSEWTSRPATTSISRLAAGDRLMKVSDRMVIVRGDRAVPMTSETILSNGSRVTVGGAVISKTGARTNLPDCAVIGYDGKRISGNAARVLMIDGQMMVMRDGVTRRIEMSVSLGGGRSVSQDGTVTERNGSRHDLLEGGMIPIGGEPKGTGLDVMKRNVGTARWSN